MPGCLSGGSSIKQLVVINLLFLPQYSDVGSRTVYLRGSVYLLLKDLAQQVAHGLSNANAPSTITQGMTGKIQGGALQVYGRPSCPRALIIRGRGPYIPIGYTEFCT